MANLIQVTVVAPKPTTLKLGAVAINVAAIQSIQTRVADTVSAGVSVINYKYTVGNHFKSELIYVSETRAALTTAANAAPAP